MLLTAIALNALVYSPAGGWENAAFAITLNALVYSPAGGGENATFCYSAECSCIFTCWRQERYILLLQQCP
jgi:hypothetical protein